MDNALLFGPRTKLQNSPVEASCPLPAAAAGIQACHARLYNGYSLTAINRPVGKGQLNRPLDVLAIQRLFNGSKATFTNQKPLTPDGVYGGELAAQVFAFQKHVLNMKHPDGIISVNGTTHNTLLTLLNPAFISRHFNASKYNEKGEVDVPHFLKLFKDQFPEEKSNLGNVEILLNYCLNDNRVTDIRWVAYMMATVKREAIGWSASSEEIGKGRTKKYNKEYEVIDPKTKQTRTNVYYGRGYCQLTWYYGYQDLGKALGMGDDLYIYPEKALIPNVSYEILSKGMIEGLITGKPLPRFINGAKCDYFQARRTINELDHADDISENALKYEMLLKASQKNQYIKRSSYVCF